VRSHFANDSRSHHEMSLDILALADSRYAV